MGWVTVGRALQITGEAIVLIALCFGILSLFNAGVSRLHRHIQVQRRTMKVELTPPGKVWVCTDCGRRSRDKFGVQPVGQTTDDRAWSEKCFIHAKLCDESTLTIVNGRVTHLTT